MVTGRAFHISFRDRASAAAILATILNSKVKIKKNREPILILGIPRGGIVVADIIAQKLKADIDLIMARKLRAPYNKENSIGAIMPDGSVYLNELKVKWLKIPLDYIEREKAEQLEEIKHKLPLYRPYDKEYNIRNRFVILVDDGVASGATIIAAARWIKKQEPRQLTIATPIAPKEVIRDLLTSEADSIEVITTPSSSQFQSVAEYYKDFSPVMDEQVIQIMTRKRVS